MSACRLSVSELYNPVLSIHATRHVASLFMICELSDRSLPRLEESRCGVPPQPLSRSPGRARLSQARDGCLGWFESKVNICSIIPVTVIVAIITRIVPTTCGLRQLSFPYACHQSSRSTPTFVSVISALCQWSAPDT